MSEPLDILYLDPFHDGSHAAVATGLAAHSRHRVTLRTLPGRAWKWRMRGAAIWMADAAAEALATSAPNAIITTDMLALADLIALSPPALRDVPIVVYFHENQLTYPDRVGAERDHHFAFTNLVSASCATEVWFNSEFHRRDFLDAIPPFIERMPDHRPRGLKERIESHSRVVYPGIDWQDRPQSPHRRHQQPVILWNHRWEHDKNPDGFVDALQRVREHSPDFRLSIVGRGYADRPAAFDRIETEFAGVLDHFGTADRERYHEVLNDADIVVSTAHHEFFGLAVCEAIAAGCYPLLPRRLSYPELVPGNRHRNHLYGSEDMLVSMLVALVTDGIPAEQARELRDDTRERFGWRSRAAAFDRAIERLIVGR